ncbi:MAG: hypothetical protein U9Q15_04385 [Patescibacteria group bacterium]|nr:hypothetical protein [Patescibacteria group bacterium]
MKDVLGISYRIVAQILDDLNLKYTEIGWYDNDIGEAKKSLYIHIQDLVIDSDQESVYIHLIESLFLYKLGAIYGRKIRIDGIKYEVYLDINSFHKKKEELFFENIDKEASLTLMYNKDRCLEPMQSHDRERIHMYVKKNFPAIASQSFGTEPFRYVRFRNTNAKKK